VAVADQLPPQVKAMIPQVTESALTLEFLRRDGLSLETPFGWGIQVDGQERRFAMLRQLLGGRRKRRALASLPLGRAAAAITGHDVDYVRDILTHDADAPRRAGFSHRDRVEQVTVPVSSIGGWPPRGYGAQRFHLQAGGALSTEPPAASAPDRYRYDPADPTPAVGGVRMVRDSGRVDNTRLETRPDVLTYTTATLEEDVEIIGEVSAEIWFRSSRPYADVFVRLCDVDARGRSYNICDGLVSLTGADEITRATVTLWPTAYRFRRGHRIRLQVSSGAFPRFARNPGTGDPQATATRLVAADQTVHHDPAHPSAVLLPVKEAP
jgi:predicted acyl esterase